MQVLSLHFTSTKPISPRDSTFRVIDRPEPQSLNISLPTNIHHVNHYHIPVQTQLYLSVGLAVIHICT